jgi:hypothetical protein
LTLLLDEERIRSNKFALEVEHLKEDLEGKENLLNEMQSDYVSKNDQIFELSGKIIELEQ